jgi:hypothetical protein
VTLAELVAAVREEHDASQAQVERWANERYRDMVSAARWLMVERPVGTTVVDQDAYPVDPEMVQLERLFVDGAEFGRVGIEDMISVRAGRGRLVGGPGVFCAGADSAGAAQVEVFPTPETAGLAITGLMTFVPDALGQNDEPLFPSHLHRYWRDGVIADAYVMLDGRHDLAAAHEQRWAQGVEMLSRVKVSRIGRGAAQAQLPRR